MPEKVVVLTGAGISAESGLKTFRDSGGLWEGYDVHDVATPEAWQQNPKLVLDFYNERRKNVLNAQPNKAHKALVRLEQRYDVQIITQNVDDLHERAGSKNVLHLHGEILKARSTRDPNLVYPWKKDMHLGDTCESGSQLRPHIVWFGEDVPLIGKAASICAQADILLVIGTSLVVYPAAGLTAYVPPHCRKIIINPNIPDSARIQGFETVAAPATQGVPPVVDELLRNKSS